MTNELFHRIGWKGRPPPGELRVKLALRKKHEPLEHP
jgi:hypothetical protein